MPKFIIPYTGEIQLEADSFDEAKERAYSFRKDVMQNLSGRLEELGLEKASMKPFREVIQGDEAWLKNRRLRAKLQVDWGYEVKEIPLVANSKVFITHRIALGPAIQESSMELNATSQTQVD